MQWISGGELAERIRAGRISSLEALEFFIDRVERLDTKETNLVVLKYYDLARERAKLADAALKRGELWGPLHGVPMTVKECLNVAGFKTTSGMPELKNYVAKKNAMVSEKLLKAGAVIFGKTNMPLRGSDIQTFNEVYGTSGNPWDVSRTPGGSSGGSAGALAMGFTPIECGSDISGSLRIPAHFCGVCSHKPSKGIISKKGHVPPQFFFEITDSLSVIGPMARCCDDLELMLNLMISPEESHSRAFSIHLPAPRPEILGENGVTNLKLAVWLDESNCRVQRSIRDAIVGAAGALQNAGATVLFDFPKPVDFKNSKEVFIKCLRFSLDFHNSEGTFGNWIRNENERMKLCKKWNKWFHHFKVDAVLCPVTCAVAFPHDHSIPMEARSITVNGNDISYMNLFKWTGIPMIAGLPVTVVPVGQCLKTGLPVGVQIIAPFLEDLTSIHVGKMLERYNRGFIPPPMAQTQNL